MVQMTEYDILADKCNISDRYTFLENLERLSKLDSKYSIILNDILEKSNSFIDIEPGLPYDDFIDNLIEIYRLDLLPFSPVYHKICKKYNIELQEYTDTDEMKHICYKTYSENYSEFIEIMHQLNDYTERLNWTLPVKNKQEINKDIPNRIPEPPYVPPLD